MKTYHRFAFAAPIRENEDPKPFKTRDGAAFNELAVGLQALKYNYGELIYNYPYSPFFSPEQITDAAELARKLANPSNGISRYLREKWDNPDCRIWKNLSTVSADNSKIEFANQLNQFINDDFVHDKTNLADVSLSPISRALLEHNFRGDEENARLNRLILEDALPTGLAKVHDFLNLGRQHFAFINPTRDLLALTTRPPLDDARAGHRRTIKRSHSDLEEAIFATLGRCFKLCARSHVQLSDEMAKHLEGDAVAKASMKFHLHNDARLSEYMALEQLRPAEVPSDKYLTIGFFIHLAKIQSFDCGMIASFGMGGTETLIWNRYVRNHPRRELWLTRPVFLVAELDLKNIPSRPSTLSFVDDVPVRILLEHAL